MMATRVVEGTVPRLAPHLTEQNRAFWTGGARGELLIQRCAACRRWVHPPIDSCPLCGGELRPEPVSGTGTLFTYTVNAHQFHLDVPPPNVIVIVQLDEQEDLRIATNLVGADDAEIRIGLPVRVLFEHQGDIYYPLFEPMRTSR
jgi:uncharacterized OB-fold protein